MIAQWDSSLSVLPWPGFNSQPRRSISRDFSLADRTLPTHPEPAWQNMAQSQSPLKDTTQPVDSEEEGRSSTMDRRWLIKKSSITNSYTITCTAVKLKTKTLSKAVSVLLLVLFLVTCNFKLVFVRVRVKT